MKIVTNKNNIRLQWDAGSNTNQKRVFFLKTCGFQIDNGRFKWFPDACSPKIPISRSVKGKAHEVCSSKIKRYQLSSI